MKNIIKNILIAILLVGVVFGNGILAFSKARAFEAEVASVLSEDAIDVESPVGGGGGGGTAVNASNAVFNSDAQDKPTLQVSNYTQNPDCKTCWSNSVTANSGDVISFLYYYHNSSNPGVTAVDTRMQLSLNNDYTNGKVTALGKLFASNAAPVYGNTIIYPQGNPAQPWTMTFHSALWYPNQNSANAVALPNGQAGSEITGPTGITIGDITASWATQGYFVVRYTFKGTDSVGNLPNVTTLQPGDITSSSATFQATVEPNGLATEYYFEYGKTESFGSRTSNGSVLGTVARQNVSAIISGLEPSTKYFVRVIARNSQGTKTGNTVQFVTPQGGTIVKTPILTTKAASDITMTSVKLNAIIDPNGSDTTYVFEYGTTQNLGTKTASQVVVAGSAKDVSATISGLSANTTYYFKVMARNGSGISNGNIISFSTTQSGGSSLIPGVITGSADAITTSSATIHGTVSPNGLATTYWFEYGKTAASLNSATAHVGVGVLPTSIQSTVSGLDANTTYYFRLVAQNNQGTTQGNVNSFKTQAIVSGTSAPSAETRLATNISYTSAQLNGGVNPNGLETTYVFEYGKTQSLGSKTATQPIGLGTTVKNVSATISGLSANTTYYFRVIARNEKGTTQGAITALTTDSAGVVGGAPNGATLAAVNITKTSATLRGQVAPRGSMTTYWFEYGTSQQLGNKTLAQVVMPPRKDDDSSMDVATAVGSLSAATTYYFRVAAQNANGSFNGPILSFTTNADGGDNGGGGNGGGGARGPLVETSNSSLISGTEAVLYGSILSNGSTATAWFEYGTNKDALNLKTSEKEVKNDSAMISFNATVSDLKAGTTYYFRAAGRNVTATTYGQTLAVSTLSNGSVSRAPILTTKAATFVSQNAALLNGVVNPNGSTATAWFEYGTTAALGYKTDAQQVGSGTNTAFYAAAISGLTRNTTYFYRAVAQNSYGKVYGYILPFHTGTQGTINVDNLDTGGVNTNQTTVRTGEVVTVNTSSFVSGTQSCVLISPTTSATELNAGEEFTYSIALRNGCGYDLSKASLKVILPTEVEYISTNYPFFEKTANGITYNIGTLKQNEQVAITITGKVSNGVTKGDIVIFSSALTFEDMQGRPQSISSYLSAEIASERTLTASIFDAFGGIFGTWWFSLLLLLIIGFLIFWIFFKRKKEDDDDSKIDVLKA